MPERPIQRVKEYQILVRKNGIVSSSSGLAQWGAADAEIKVPSAENTELKVPPLKPGVSQYIAIHATLTARDFFLVYSTLPVHSPAFFPKPLPIFPCVGCG